jgi:imidazolonepropionase-like amidohydrolase
MSVYRAMSERGPELGAPEYIRRKTAEVLEASREAFRLALEAGVPVAAGTDCGAPGHPHGTLPEELMLMVESGASPIQALRFGTSAAADLLGLGDEVGSLEPGKRAISWRWTVTRRARSWPCARYGWCCVMDPE